MSLTFIHPLELPFGLLTDGYRRSQVLYSRMARHHLFWCVCFTSLQQQSRGNSILSEITVTLCTYDAVTSWAACIPRVIAKCVLTFSYRNCFVQDSDIISRQLERAAQLTVGALIDVPLVFSGQTFDANT